MYTISLSNEISYLEKELFASRNLFLKKSASIYNLDKFKSDFYNHISRDIYVDRNASLLPVRLVRFKDNTMVLGDGHFTMCSGKIFIKEHFPPYYESSQDNFDRLAYQIRGFEIIRDETVIVARYGIATWGHWLGELLPKIAVCERFYPGRFKYAVPIMVIEDRSLIRPWIRILESIEAYGINKGRLVGLKPDVNYAIPACYDILNIWSDHVMNIEVLNIIREDIRLSSPEKEAYPSRLAIRRVEGSGRVLVNSTEIFDILTSNRFDPVQVGSLKFCEQIHHFRSAEIIFSTLGSDLTNVIYSQNNTKIISVSPDSFGDRFFYALIAEIGGNLIDVRGKIVEENPIITHKSSFRIDSNELGGIINTL